jgi:hypothetical protein
VRAIAAAFSRANRRTRSGRCGARESGVKPNASVACGNPARSSPPVRLPAVASDAPTPLFMQNLQSIPFLLAQCQSLLCFWQLSLAHHNRNFLLCSLRHFSHCADRAAWQMPPRSGFSGTLCVTCLMSRLPGMRSGTPRITPPTVRFRSFDRERTE